MTYSYILICTGHFDNIFLIKMSVWPGVKGVDAPSKQAIAYLIVPNLVGYGGANEILGWDVFRKISTKIFTA